MRLAAGFTSPEAFAKVAGVRKQTVYNWERRLDPPPPSGVQKIATTLGLSPDQVRGYATISAEEHRTGIVEEEGSPYGLRALPSPDEIAVGCRLHLERFIVAARQDVQRLGWVKYQLDSAFPQIPATWAREDRAEDAAQRMLEETGPQPEEAHGEAGDSSAS